MSYAFCFGPSGSGKSRCLREMIIRRAGASLTGTGRDRTKYIVIVPEQYSLQTQRELVRDHPAGVLMNIDVLSFGRLAYRVFQETGEDKRTVLDEVGKSLLLRRVASRCEKDLQILHRGIHSPGMIDEVKSVLSEFMQYGVGEEQMKEMAAYAAEHGRHALAARLSDIQTLYKSFCEEEKDRYLTSEETLDLLAKTIPDAQSLKGSVIVFDGFTGFTTVQYRVVMALLRCAKEVTFSFTAAKDQGPEIRVTAAGGPAGSEAELFYLTRRTVYDIIKMASKEGIPRGRDLFLSFREVPRFRGSRVLSHLERCLFRHPLVPFEEKEEKEVSRSLRVFAVTTPQEEVRQIFREIQGTAARTGCAWRDFAIVTADLETYGDLFALEADRAGVPVYIDRTSGVFHNILIEGIRSVLQISAESFSYQSVFRYLRSGLSSLSEEEVDLLENYCLAHGIRGRKKWTLPFDADCEEARVRFLQEVKPVTGLDDQETERRRPRTAAVRTRELYGFLVGCGAQAKMEMRKEEFSGEGDVVREKQYSQIYRSVIDLLDRIYRLAGEEVMSARDYLELLEAGFAQIRLGTLPQRVDRILVGDMERTRLTQIRHLFFAGVNEGNIPRSASRGGILSDMDREFLTGTGIALAPSPRQQMFTQRLYLYLNMTKPSETLTLSFSKTSQDGRSLRPSYLISILRGLFPALRVSFPEEEEAWRRVFGKEDARSLLADCLRTFVEGSRKEDPGFQRSFSLLYGFHTSPEVMADPLSGNAVLRLKRAALYRYRPESLRTETARALYRDRIQGGISRMETAAKCLFMHHLKYGLHLRERDLYEYAPLDGGTVLHGALQRFDALLQESGLRWDTFSAEEARVLAGAALQAEAAQYRELLLYKSARDERRLSYFLQRLLRTVEMVQYQFRRGDFFPVAAELQFGESRGEPGRMPPIRYALGHGRSLTLVGRIDRFDMCAAEGRRYLRIMDFKSGRYDLDPEMIRRGLQLQLITYMQALLGAGPKILDSLASRDIRGDADRTVPGPGRSADTGIPGRTAEMEAVDPASAAVPFIPEEDRSVPEAVPSAMLYYRIDDPVIRLDPQGAFSSMRETEDGILDERLDRIRGDLRPTGLCLLDDSSIRHLDRQMSGRSDVIPVGVKKDGSYMANSALLTPEEYRELAETASQKIRSIAESILDGDVTASPAVLKDKKSACDLCVYREVCGFDPRIPGYQKRIQ